MADHPFDEVYRTALDVFDRGGSFYQKFTCGQCGSRQTMSTVNQFFTRGRCEECEYITDITLTGCNLLVVYSRKQPEPVFERQVH